MAYNFMWIIDLETECKYLCQHFVVGIAKAFFGPKPEAGHQPCLSWEMKAMNDLRLVWFQFPLVLDSVHAMPAHFENDEKCDGLGLLFTRKEHVFSGRF